VAQQARVLVQPLESFGLGSAKAPMHRRCPSTVLCRYSEANADLL
jgi:hypothetical protein